MLCKPENAHSRLHDYSERVNLIQIVIPWIYPAADAITVKMIGTLWDINLKVDRPIQTVGSDRARRIRMIQNQAGQVDAVLEKAVGQKLNCAREIEFPQTFCLSKCVLAQSFS